MSRTKKYAYFFIMGAQIVWSGDQSTSLLKRCRTEKERKEIEGWMATARPGEFTELDGGIAVCTDEVADE